MRIRESSAAFDRIYVALLGLSSFRHAEPGATRGSLAGLWSFGYAP
jgi:hypothetical protein